MSSSNPRGSLTVIAAAAALSVLGLATPAAATSGDLDFSVNGSTNHGGFSTKGTSPVTIPDSAPAAPVVTTTQYNAGVTNTFAGTGAKGATLRILNASNTELAKDVKVGSSGTWSFARKMSASAAYFEFKVEQTVAGTTTTTKTVRVPAVKNWQPIAIDNPYVSSGIVSEFTGTGTPGATLRVLNISNTQIVNNTIRVEEDGTWKFTRGISNDVANFRMKIEQNLGGEVRTSALFTINAAPIAQATITGPTKVTPGKVNTFTGTVQPGAVIRVLNGSGSAIVPAEDITVNASGQMTFTRLVSSAATEFTFKVEQAQDGYVRTSNVFRVKR